MSGDVTKIAGFDFDSERAQLPSTKLELYLISKSLMNYVLAQQIVSLNRAGDDRDEFVRKLKESEVLLDGFLTGLVTNGGVKLDTLDVAE